MGFKNRGFRAFTWEEVDTIRAAYARGESQGSLARLYGVTVNTIARMVRGETYQVDSRTKTEQPLVRPMNVNYHDPHQMKMAAERIQKGIEQNPGPLTEQPYWMTDEMWGEYQEKLSGSQNQLEPGKVGE
jgi:hypothetical protein